MLERGALVISLDTELLWGFHGFEQRHELSADGSRERDLVSELIALFDRYDAPVTWAIVGHLFLDECDGVHGDLASPSFDAVEGDWYDTDPGTSTDADPLRYAPQTVESICSASTEHEIATHTFSHVLCGRDGCSPAVVRAELRRCRELTAERGRELTTLVFPRNEIGHLDVVAEEGIEIYRGLSAETSLRRSAPLGRHRAYLRYVTRQAPEVVTPRQTTEGLWNLPASQYLPYNTFPNFHEWFPVHPRVVRARKALRRAKADGKVFHLWSHPHNFDKEMMRDLERILEFADEIDVPVLTVRDAVSQFRGERSTEG